MLGASLVLHRWLADDKRGKNPKASKREGCEMIICKMDGEFITMMASHHHSNWCFLDFRAPI
jgi:hypothetical protein